MLKLDFPIKSLNSVEQFSANIPTEIESNLAFRQQLHQLCAKDKAVREIVWRFYQQDIIAAWRTLFWTFNPKNRGKNRNMPFLPWPIQVETILKVQEAIHAPHDILIDKSRDMGCTWIVLGCYFYEFLFVTDSHFLVASRKEEYVDKRGDHKCLFSKLVYLNNHLPDWIKVPVEKTHMHMRNPNNESVIDGESTNPDLGAGDRRASVMLDEFARVDAADAASISETLSDTTDCVIYSSTHTSRQHPYAKLRYGGAIPVTVLPWWKRPERAVGLYTSPEPGKVRIDDIEFYQKKYQGVFDTYQAGTTVPVDEFEMSALFQGEPNALFVADGTAKWRSVWYDAQCRRRSSRDVAQNLDMDPVGSGDMVFDGPVLQRMRTDIIVPAKFEGEVLYKVIVGKDHARFKEQDHIENVRFAEHSGRKRLKWWGELENGRPLQDREYVIGCDISLGTGTSNSVASIYDYQTHYKVGSWVCSQTSPTSFAEQVVALGKWVGGASQNKGYLIWEANGVGQIFGRRVHELGYGYYYRRRDEKKFFRPRGSDAGWHSSSQTKMDLIIRYREAMAMAFRLDDQDKRFLNPDEDAVREAEDYVFFSASTLGPASAEEEEAGAQATHGDRVIADALCCLGREDVMRTVVQQVEKVPVLSYAARRRDYDKRQRLAEDARWN